MYSRHPEYWGIEVVGSLPDVGLPVITPYTDHRELNGTIGTCGIEVIGASRSEKIDISSYYAEPQASLRLSITSAASGQPSPVRHCLARRMAALTPTRPPPASS